jgi:hypothetical protein
LGQWYYRREHKPLLRDRKPLLSFDISPVLPYPRSMNHHYYYRWYLESNSLNLISFYDLYFLAVEIRTYGRLVDLRDSFPDVSIISLSKYRKTYCYIIDVFPTLNIFW